MPINTCEAQMANLLAFSKTDLAKKYGKIKIISKSSNMKLREADLLKE